MSKKIELSTDQTNECIRLYNDELLGSSTISEKMGVHKTIIIRTLRENGVILGSSGRRNIGGKTAANKKYYKKNSEDILSSYKIWAKNNRVYLRKKHSEWRDANREHVNKYSREYEAKRCASDPKYKLGRYTRTALWTCLKERNVAKYRSTFQLLGYSIDDLMKHLEGLFIDGMTWDNYGEWHVDHKKPMALFEFTSTDDEGFKECWSLNNLQPLWAPDNLSKGIRYL